MGLGGISIWQLVIILAIVLLLFGSKKLRNIGGDLGSAVKGFKNAVNDGAKTDEKADPQKLDKKADAAFSEQAQTETSSDTATEAEKSTK